MNYDKYNAVLTLYEYKSNHIIKSWYIDLTVLQQISILRTNLASFIVKATSFLQLNITLCDWTPRMLPGCPWRVAWKGPVAVFYWTCLGHIFSVTPNNKRLRLITEVADTWSISFICEEHWRMFKKLN